jgi:DNA-directed RNA polymerase specialized sigma24 family protein
MVSDSITNPDDFDEILDWLDPDREVAANMYVQLRHDVARIFVWNACPDPEGLTDEVFDRVARKVHTLRQTYEGDPRLFFYGVARNLVKETAKKIKTYASFDEARLILRRAQVDDLDQKEVIDARGNCLRSCLKQLDSEQRKLILDYYSMGKQGNIPHRAKMAAQLGISLETLRVRIYRIRVNLEQCTKRCLNRQGFKNETK